MTGARPFITNAYDHAFQPRKKGAKRQRESYPKAHKTL